MSRILQGCSNLKDVIMLILEKIQDEDNDLQLECVKGLAKLIEEEVFCFV